MLYFYKIILLLPLMFPNIPLIFPTIFPFLFSLFSFSVPEKSVLHLSHLFHLFNISFYIFMTSDYLLYHKSCDLSCDLYFHYYFIFQVQVLFALIYYLDTSADVFYVELYEKVYAKFTYTILCGFKNPTWILCDVSEEYSHKCFCH